MEFRIHNSGFRVQGSGVMVEGLDAKRACTPPPGCWRRRTAWNPFAALVLSFLHSGPGNRTPTPTDKARTRTQLICRNAKWFRRRLESKAHRLAYPLTLGPRVIRKKRRSTRMVDAAMFPRPEASSCAVAEPLPKTPSRTYTCNQENIQRTGVPRP